MSRLRRFALAAAAFAALAVAAPLAEAETVLRGVSMFPQNFLQTESLKKFIARVNEATQGEVVFELIGGPEIIPVPKQGEALKNGVVDFAYIAPTNAIGIFPEAEAFANSFLTPMERRERGGMELFDALIEKRLNAKLLQFIDGGVSLHLFLKKEPPRTAEGGIDLTGLRLRSSELYIPFFRALGTTPVVLQSPELYTALERNAIDGFGFSIHGVRDAGWHKHVTAWVEPPMYWTSTFVAVNRDRWNTLPPEMRETIQRVAIEYERESYEAFAKAQDEERKELEKAGLKRIDLSGKAAEDFVELAHRTLWSKVKENPAVEIDHAEVLQKWHGRAE